MGEVRGGEETGRDFEERARGDEEGAKGMGGEMENGEEGIREKNKGAILLERRIARIEEEWGERIKGEEKNRN